MGEDQSTTCEMCGQTFFYAPKFHECDTRSEVERERDLHALLTRTGRYRESWVDECMRKVGAKR